MAHLAIAGEGGVVEQEVSTEEEDNSIKHAQARPVQEDRPAEERVLRYVPEKEGLGKKEKWSKRFIVYQRNSRRFLPTSPVQGGLPLECLHGDMLLNQAVEEDWE